MNGSRGFWFGQQPVKLRAFLQFNSLYADGVELTGIVTDAALDTLLLVYVMEFLLFTGDGLLRAF